MAVPVAEVDMPEVQLDPANWEEQRHLLIDLLQAGDWIARTPLGYIITRYDDAAAMLRDGRWHSAIGLIAQMQGYENPEFQQRSSRNILAMEGEEHHRIRRLVGPAFTPRSAERLRPFMAEVINELLDPVCARGSAEVVSEICEPYPIPIICEMLGAPREDWKLFGRLATDIFKIFNGNLHRDGPAIAAAQDEMNAYMTALISQRRAAPREDLLSDLIAAEEAGDRLSTEELLSLANSLLLAGTDTTRNQLACAVALFCQHPGQLRLIADDPSLAAGAVEEVMRCLGAVRGTARFASEPITYRGIEFPPNTFIFPSLVGANHDSEKFDEPCSFDITRRSGTPQMTFGSGIHHCLGAFLARAELQEAVAAIARRMPGLHLDSEAQWEAQWKPLSDGIWGPTCLPVRFTPGH